MLNWKTVHHMFNVWPHHFCLTCKYCCIRTLNMIAALKQGRQKMWYEMPGWNVRTGSVIHKQWWAEVHHFLKQMAGFVFIFSTAPNICCCKTAVSLQPSRQWQGMMAHTLLSSDQEMIVLNVDSTICFYRTFSLLLGRFLFTILKLFFC